MNPHFPVNTVQIMRGALMAESDGALMPYIDSVFRHMWEEPKKMDDTEIIRAALNASGLDGARILAGTQEQVIKDGLLKNTQASVAAVPSVRLHSSSATRSSSARTSWATWKEEIESAKARAD
jgi:2-hydroxychromene-2-carboxylate isomerase